jgi:protein-S-isoprenylcysteine O-methyltransferase Ste14
MREVLAGFRLAGQAAALLAGAGADNRKGLMRKMTAAAGSAAFFAVAPGVVAGLVPWMITGWHAGSSYPVPLRVAGVVLVATGGAVLVSAFGRFVVEGVGTPSPSAPTQQLVIGGLYRYVRNPMYLAVLAAIAGQALMLSRPVLLTYAVAVGAAVWAFVRWYEEPTLARRYGTQYEVYRHEVPAWWPRLPYRRKPPPEYRR